MDSDDSIEELMSAGYEALESENYADAINFGEELIERRHSSGFEIAALAYQREGEIGKAIELLEEGVKQAASVWVLWKLLGDCYSYAGRLDDAEKAYQAALARNQPDVDLIHLNRGIAFQRQEKWADAENAFFRVKAKKLRRRALAELIRIAANSGNSALAAERATALMNQQASDEEDLDRRGSSSILSAVALGLFHGKDFVRAKEYALLAAELNPSNSESLWIIREAHGNRARNAIGYTFILQGELDDDADQGKHPFMRTLQIVAQDVDAALNYAREFFSETVCESLRVEEVNEFDASEYEFEGVYFVSGYITYPRDSE
jgi:tetratricopeptide (TPR) repeat protein